MSWWKFGNARVRELEAKIRELEAKNEQYLQSLKETRNLLPEAKRIAENARDTCARAEGSTQRILDRCHTLELENAHLKGRLKVLEGREEFLARSVVPVQP